jgi:hypothetical protein
MNRNLEVLIRLYRLAVKRGDLVASILLAGRIAKAVR